MLGDPVLQNIEGKLVEVVTFSEMPELPVTGLTREEAIYSQLTDTHGAIAKILPPHQGWTYARALTDAIERGIISEPGKYGIHFCNPGTGDYEIYRIS